MAKLRSAFLEFPMLMAQNSILFRKGFTSMLFRGALINEVVMPAVSLVLGVGMFFVLWEPAPFDIVASLLIITKLPFLLVVLLYPPFFLFFVTQIASVLLEFFLFGTFFWSLVSVYLFLASIAFIGIFGTELAEFTFIVGAAVGAAITLGAYAMGVNTVVYDSARLVGFFKDPNVLGATALGLLFLAWPKSKALSLLFLSCLLLSLSRASLLSLVFGWFIVLLCSMCRRNKIILTGASILLAPVLLVLMDALFGIVGRGGLINNYDFGRVANWHDMLLLWSSTNWSLGPGFSEMSGYAVHSTYLRLFVEQGPLALLCFIFLVSYALWCSRSDKWVIAAISSVSVNAVVIDGTHWRILFVILAVAICRGIMRDRVFVDFCELMHAKKKTKHAMVGGSS